LAAAPFLAQLLQAPAVVLIERLRRRRDIAVWSSVMGRAALAGMALAAFAPATGVGVTTLVIMQFIFCGMGAVGGCAWNTWLRDLVPDRRLGGVVARRTRYGAIVGMAAGLLAALALDWAQADTTRASATYAGLYFAAFAAGLVSAWLVARIPEPPMAPTPPVKIAPMLRAPLKDRNFRRTSMFLGSWQFAVNLASPFFTVYLLRQLGLDITIVMLMSAASQLANILTLRVWGSLADRFSNKSVLGVAAPLFLACIASFALASQIEPGWGLIAFLVMLHAAMGIASAGVTLATANIVLKLSPRGEASAWLATSALITAAAAGSAALLGGLFAEFFAQRQLELVMHWTNPNGVTTLAPLRLSNWDFYFLLAALLGLFALHRLAFVKEEGDVDRKAMLEQVVLQARRSLRDISTAATAVADIPGAFVREAAARARLDRVKSRLPPDRPEAGN
ncbi:MAG: MFS transporter, partial [Burkholderiales bacterium]